MKSGSKLPGSGYTGPPEDRTRYEVPDVRGFRRGGTGVVYEATLTRAIDELAAGTRIGLKMMPSMESSRFEKLRERSPRIPRHPNLARHVECFSGPPPTAAEAGEDDFVFYSAHVWVVGRSLDDASLDAGPQEILGWGRQIALALDALHSTPGGGLAHRDVYGKNIIVTPSGDAVLIDFDTILRGDASDTGLSVLSGLGAGARARGLPGAQAEDRALLALALLRAFARDGSSHRPAEELPGSALATLRGKARDPEGVVAVLTEALDSPPATALALIDSVEAHFTRAPGRRARGAGWTRSTRAGMIAVGSAAVVVVLVLLMGRLAHWGGASTAAGGAGTPRGVGTVGASGTHRGAPDKPRSHKPGHRRSSPTAGSSGPAQTTSGQQPASQEPSLGPSSAPPSHHPHHSPTTTAPTATKSSTEAPQTLAETSGSLVNTWTDYSTGTGTKGPTRPSNDTVQIACRLRGFVVADGNPWWYRVASDPWSGGYYGSADAFYNNGATSGSLHGTPFVDTAVPVC
jgi:hypothetical protein